MPKRVVQPNQARGNLQIEQVSRRLPAPQMAQPYLFAAGVYDNLIGRIDHDFPECVQRPHCERIDEEQLFFRGDLDQAQLRMIAFLADELGVQSKMSAGRQMGAAVGQLGRLDDQLFDLVIHTVLRLRTSPRPRAEPRR